MKMRLRASRRRSRDPKGSSSIERREPTSDSTPAMRLSQDGPYGPERSYNGLRLALALARTDGTAVKVFLMADAVACAKSGQTTPEGYYNVGRMLKGLTTRGVEVGTCGSCMDARSYADADLAKGVCRSSMPQLAAWTQWADKVVTF